jgi:predicted phosphodiesterase
LVVLNEYCDVSGDTVTGGDITDHLYNWLVADLEATDQEHIFVFGHEPAYPQPDADNGRESHMADSLNFDPAHRDRFWELLKTQAVDAYICGHTHNYSAVEIDGVWQLDTGHARGWGDVGASSTFVIIQVHGDTVTFETFRDDAMGGDYTLTYSGTLTADGE